MTQLWFTSDWHLYHKNIISFEKRPFNPKKIEDMNEKIIQLFNQKVKKKDIVFFLGDMALTSNQDKIKKIFNQVNGFWTFIMGNHDYKYNLYPIIKVHTTGLYDLLSIKWKNQQIILCHYPLFEWENKYYGSWHLHGHTHKKTYPELGYIMNISIDANNFRPVSFDDVKKYMKEKDEYSE